MIRTKKHHTAAIQRSLETRAKAPMVHFDSRKYIQHNLNLEDGLAPILAFMDALPPERTSVQILRAFEDGDYSVAHARYELGDWGYMVGFEVHRWEDERIVEHWDNLQSLPAGVNASGRSMVDGGGGLDADDLDRTDANKALVARFVEEVLIARTADWADGFFDGDALIQHSPGYGDGVGALRGALGARGGPSYTRLHNLLGEGEMVLAICEGTTGDERTPSAFYDLYRLQNGVIAEHWDVTETIPPRETWKNDNGKF